MEEIIKRLRNKNSIKSQYLKESLPVQGIREEDEEEEIHAPAEIDSEEVPEEEYSPEEEETVDAETPEDSPSLESEDEEEEKHSNPLDNMYAVNYELGQEVVLTYSTGKKTKLHGVIDGYDTEGFYRIKWDNGNTTNGLTDLALSDFVNGVEENSCVCGGKKFVNEGTRLVCDVCGRYIREGSDALSLADKSRPADKKLIRSEAHPLRTTIQDSIRSAMRGRVKESKKSPYFDYLEEKLKGEFWTRFPEMKEDIEDLGYTVDEMNAEYIIVSGEDEDGDIHEMQIPLGGTSRTMTLDFDRAREV